MGINYKSILFILLLTIIFPLIGGIEPGSAAIFGFLLLINIIYIFSAIVHFFFFHWRTVNNQIIKISRIALLVVYFLFCYLFFKDKLWMSTSVIIPEILFGVFRNK